MQGYYKPKYPQKYRGDPTNIVYRSSWELKFLRFLDTNPNVLQYASEEFFIPYVSPIDGKVHRYFPDFWIKKRNINNVVEVVVVEIKPLKQTIPPTPKTKITKQYINEVRTWGVNEAKWKAANKYCESKGWKFLLATEKDLGIKI
jgi:hypothetical protein